MPHQHIPVLKKRPINKHIFPAAIMAGNYTWLTGHDLQDHSEIIHKLFIILRWSILLLDQCTHNPT